MIPKIPPIKTCFSVVKASYWEGSYTEKRSFIVVQELPWKAWTDAWECSTPRHQSTPRPKGTSNPPEIMPTPPRNINKICHFQNIPGLFFIMKMATFIMEN